VSPSLRHKPPVLPSVIGSVVFLIPSPDPDPPTGPYDHGVTVFS